MKNTPFKKDWFLLGTVTGAVAAVAKTGLGRILDGRGIPVINHADIAANALLGRRRRPLLGYSPKATKKDMVLGYVGDAVVGSLFGMLLSYLYARSQPGHETAKGAIGSTWLWASSLVFGNLVGWYPLTRLTSPKTLNTLWITMVFGSMQGWVMGRYAAKMPLQSHPIIVKQAQGHEYDENRMKSLTQNGKR